MIDVQIGTIPVVLRSDLPEVLDDFAALYRGFPRVAADARPRAIHMHVRAARRTLFGRRRYDVVGDGEALSTDLPAAEVLPHLEWGINHRVIATRPELVQIHAASLEHRGRGVILAGTSGAGKSTLAAGLLARGWRYLCDEFALIEPATLTLLPFPKPVCIKAGSFGVVRELRLPLARRRYVKPLKGPVAYVGAPPPDQTAGPRSTPIRLVLFPTYTGAAAPRLVPVARAKAVFTLAGQGLNPSAVSPAGLAVLRRVVEQAACAGLASGPVAPTCDLIESLLDRAPNR